MAKPNWKIRGLPRFKTEADLKKEREARRLEERIRGLPKELQQAIRERPSLLSSL